MDPREIAQCAQMRDEEWDVLYVTSTAFSLHDNNFLLIHSPQSIYPECLTSSERPDPSSPQEAIIKLDIPVEIGEHDIQIYRTVCNLMANGEPIKPPPNEDDSAEEPAMDRLANLPPFFLTLVLPIEYPMRRPPILRTVHATNDWLPGSAVVSVAKRLQEI